VTDQAHELRRMAASRPLPVLDEPVSAHALVLGSGKGGVGKSALAVMFAGALARAGRRVLLVDAAQNHGNLHVLLGVRPLAGLAALLAGSVEPAELVVPIAANLALVPSDSGSQATYQLSSMDRARIQERVSSLYSAYDFVVIEGGPGIEGAVRATLGASRLAVVTVPEPAALSDAYALIKILHLQMPSVAADVLVNGTSAGGECEAVFERLALGARRFLGREISLLGEVPLDDGVRVAVREPGRLLTLDSPAAAAVAQLADRLLAAGAAASHAAGESGCRA
jgi:flagellar biosynthesis protein FlhG